MSPRRKAIIPETNVSTEVIASVDKALEETKGFLQKKETITPTVEEQKPLPTFIEVEEPEIRIDVLKLSHPNPNYTYRWCQESKVSNGRSGMWHVVDKKHPDFASLRVPIDHTPDKTFFRFKDLVLCCCRKETADKRRKLHLDSVKARSEHVGKKFGEDIKKIQKSLGNRSEALSVLEQMDEDLASS